MPSSPDALTSLFSGTPRPVPLPRRVLRMKESGAASAPVSAPASPEFLPPPARKRTPIWDMHASVHCSIIGTCLPCAEIRRLLIKLGIPGAATTSDHDLHKEGVALAGKAQGGGKFIHKALDHRHAAAIRQFAKAKDAEALTRLWEDAVRRGDIPGAYWAVLSHPLATDAVMRKAFGDVHMLSHMVGAANRADIRRLRQLEEDNAALSAKLEAQQRQLRDGFIERDGRIRLLNDALSRALAHETVTDADDDTRAAREAILDLERRHDRETARRERLEDRLQAALRAQSEAEDARRDAVRDCANLRRELALVEAELANRAEDASDALQLHGAEVLYVGGRAHQVPQLRAVVERAGGVLLHHDGGIEHSMTLLPGLIGRAACSVFPVDCVSHDAMGLLKRQCRLSAKPFVALRTSSVASLLAGLSTLSLVPAEGVCPAS